VLLTVDPGGEGDDDEFEGWRERGAHVGKDRLVACKEQGQGLVEDAPGPSGQAESSPDGEMVMAENYSEFLHDPIFVRDGVSGPEVITSATTAEAVLALWRRRPHQAKFRRKEHFGKLYRDIFEGLSAPQGILAVLIFRAVERARRAEAHPAPFLPYASHYISMVLGQVILSATKIRASEISHRNFSVLKVRLDEHFDEDYTNAIALVERAIEHCYGAREISLQQLTATFRRGDLLEMLDAYE